MNLLQFIDLVAIPIIGALFWLQYAQGRDGRAAREAMRRDFATALDVQRDRFDDKLSQLRGEFQAYKEAAPQRYASQNHLVAVETLLRQEMGEIKGKLDGITDFLIKGPKSQKE